ncbi:MAG: M28 family peptidase [candidate division Zixibacteria bacterium]|nr:M28 family peptidase [candidate division Zixibacteria bacterium]
MMKAYALTGVIAVFLAGFAACGDRRVQPPPFNADRSFRYLEEQVAFGPRVPGSTASARCRDYFYRHFAGLGLAIDSQAFAYFDPYSATELRLVNVIAKFESASKDAQRLVLMAHYDSRPRAEYASDSSLRETPIDGANDGASAVAVLMELANMLAEQAAPCHIDLVLSDGEDWGKPGDNANYLLGSRQFARSGIRDKYRFGVVIDMIGDRDQWIYREGFSERFHKDLNDMVWSTAARLGVETFIDSIRDSVLDDHLSLCAAGVPAVNIIDFDYIYWHTEFDTPDKCSAEALANVGRVLAEIVYNPSLWPTK